MGSRPGSCVLRSPTSSFSWCGLPVGLGACSGWDKLCLGQLMGIWVATFWPHFMLGGRLLEHGLSKGAGALSQDESELGTLYCLGLPVR